MRAEDSLIIRYDNGDDDEHACFVFRQKVWPGGPLHRVSKKEAQRVAELWRRGPHEITPAEFQEMAEIVFTTPTCCLGCWMWGNHGECFHVDAVREFLGLPTRRDPGLRRLIRRRW